MAVEEVPKAYRYVCDGCGAEYLQENVVMPFANSCPPDWMTLRINRTNKVVLPSAETTEVQATVDLLLCEVCRATVEAGLEFTKTKEAASDQGV